MLTVITVLCLGWVVAWIDEFRKRRTQYHTRTAILLRTIIYFQHYYTRTAVGHRWKPNHRVVISFTQDRAWEKTVLPRSSRLYLFVLKVVACLASWSRGNTFPSRSNVRRHRRHSRSEISHEPPDIFFDLYVGLHGPGWLSVIGMPPRGYLRL